MYRVPLVKLAMGPVSEEETAAAAGSCVAWTRPMGLSSEGEDSGLAKRGVYHKA